MNYEVICLINDPMMVERQNTDLVVLLDFEIMVWVSKWIQI